MKILIDNPFDYNAQFELHVKYFVHKVLSFLQIPHYVDDITQNSITIHLDNASLCGVVQKLLLLHPFAHESIRGHDVYSNPCIILYFT